MPEPLAPKQLKFITEATAKWNLAHGSVRSGKTVCTAFAFMHQVDRCPDSRIYIVGHTFDSAYRNVIRLLMESKELAIFRPFLAWSGKKLHYKDKSIIVLGAKDEGAIGNFQGDTYSLVYCDEMTLYPESIIMMLDSRLSQPHSRGYAAMNPMQPSHKLKQWIDEAEAGNPDYYALHFTLDDNPYVDETYKARIKQSSTGIFYKRNYLGLWCLAEGAIFDFFDKDIHVVKKPPRAAEYWIAGLDFGTSNAFACLLIGVSTGRYIKQGKCLWVEKEYYWDVKQKGRQKTVSEFAMDVKEFLEPYAVSGIYLDPSALPLKLDLQKLGMHVIPANNEVLDGIQIMTSEMAKGNLYVCAECKNTIREIESYVWDEKKAIGGEDAPKKKADHAVDALRYALATHKVNAQSEYQHSPYKYQNDRFKSEFR